MEGSAGRRLASSASAAACARAARRSWRHPCWTAGTVVRGLRRGGPPGDCRGARARVISPPGRRRCGCRRRSPMARSAPTTSLAIRWIGPIAIRSRTREALLCHPPAGGRVSRDRSRRIALRHATCALSPQVWRRRPPEPVRFTDRRQRAGGRTGRATVERVDGRAARLDRRASGTRSACRCRAPTRLHSTSTSRCRRVGAGGAGETSRGRCSASPASSGAVPRAEIRRSIRPSRRRCAPTASPALVAILRRAPASPTRRPSAYPRGSRANTPSEAQLACARRRCGGAAPPAAHQHHHAGLQHRSALAARLRRVGPPPGLPELGALPVRRRVAVGRRPSSAARVRRRPAHPHRSASRATAGSPARRTLRSAVATGEFVALLDHDDELTPDALAEVVRAPQRQIPTPTSSTPTKTSSTRPGERCDAYFKPDWSPEHFLHLHVHLPLHGRAARRWSKLSADSAPATRGRRTTTSCCG